MFYLEAAQANSGLSLKDLISPTISVLALMFTVGSFWWNNWRRGRLRVDLPRSFCATETSGKTKVLLPLALQNTGPTAIAISALRLHLKGSTGAIRLPHVRNYEELRPDPNKARLATNLMISGREVKIVYGEFEARQISVLVRGWNVAHLEVVIKGKWHTCGDCSFFLSPSAFAQLTHTYNAHDNMDLMPL